MEAFCQIVETAFTIAALRPQHFSVNYLTDTRKFLNRLIIKGIINVELVRIRSLSSGFGNPIATFELELDQFNGGSLVGLAYFGLAGMYNMETSTPYEP